MQKNKKDLSFFGFSQVFNHQFIQKNKKTLRFFFSFFKVMTKKQKKLEENQKKQTWASDQTFSEKFFCFLVFWFSRGFIKIILLKEKSFIKGRVFMTLYTQLFEKYKIDAKEKTRI